MSACVRLSERVRMVRVCLESYIRQGANIIPYIMYAAFHLLASHVGANEIGGNR